jgi:hypothetical protein
MEKQFFVFDEVSNKYIGQYFSIEKTLVNSTEISPISDFCEWNGTEWIVLTNTNIEVPSEVQLWRIRTILKVSGMETAIETALNNMQEPQKTAALYIWNYGTTVERESATVLMLQSVLGLTDTQTDDIFIQAQNISI